MIPAPLLSASLEGAMRLLKELLVIGYLIKLSLKGHGSNAQTGTLLNFFFRKILSFY